MSSVPAVLARTAELMADYPHRWFLCGGWAVDAWLGRPTRSHSDVDIAIVHDEQMTLYEYLGDWDMIGHDPNVADDCPDRWNGRPLDLPAHIHAYNNAVLEVQLEIYLNAIIDDMWICRPSISCRMNGPSPRWAVPTVPAELVLFYKAGGNLDQLDQLRPQDEQDFRALVPLLTPEQHRWLDETLNQAHPNHPWRALLTHSRRR